MIWLRAESRPTERRAPLVPEDAARLVAEGLPVTVERDAKRVFPDAAYEGAGCALAEAGSWTQASADALILGVKELPPEPETLRGRYAHFAHLYKDQRGWREALARFARGGAILHDLEYLTDSRGRRVAAFGYWAGWIGAAIGLRGWLERARGIVPGAVEPRDDRAAFLRELRALADGIETPRAVVIGAKGRSGRGACDLFDALRIPVTAWDVEHTDPLDRAALLDHDILVSCVLTTGPGPVFVRAEDLPGARLSTISDVACDPLSDFNPIPLYDAPTSWDAPFLGVGGEGGALLTAIDNLPSLLPRDASEDFSAQLLPVLRGWPDGVPWRNARAAFDAALARL